MKFVSTKAALRENSPYFIQHRLVHSCKYLSEHKIDVIFFVKSPWSSSCGSWRQQEMHIAHSCSSLTFREFYVSWRRRDEISSFLFIDKILQISLACKSSAVISDQSEGSMWETSSVVTLGLMECFW